MAVTQDEDAIRKLIAGMEDAWNRHDMHAWCAPFAEDADFVNVAGIHRRGRAAIEALHVEQHREILKNTRQRYTDVRIRFPKPDRGRSAPTVEPHRVSRRRLCGASVAQRYRHAPDGEAEPQVGDQRVPKYHHKGLRRSAATSTLRHEEEKFDKRP